MNSEQYTSINFYIGDTPLEVQVSRGGKYPEVYHGKPLQAWYKTYTSTVLNLYLWALSPASIETGLLLVLEVSAPTAQLNDVRKTCRVPHLFNTW
jgi:hypothetical protein